MLLPNNAFVAVVDGEHFSLFRNAGRAPDVELELVATPGDLAGEAGSGARHHSSSANPDGRRLAEDDFAAAVADWLNSQVLSGTIGALFVIATPKTLGELRLRYHPQLQSRLIGEEAKDLIGHPRSEVEALVAKAR